MRANWRRWIALICVILGLSAGTVRAEEKSHGCKTDLTGLPGCEDDPLWYTRVDLIVLHRNVGTNATLVTNTTFTKTLNVANDFDINWDAGPRILIGRRIDDDNAIEVGYLGLYSMRASLSQDGPGKAFNLPTSGVNFGIDYRATMNTLELNHRCWLNGKHDSDVSVLGGFRYVNWHEDIHGNFKAVGAAGTPTTAYDLTNNNLFGAQIGAEWQATVGERCGIDVFGKFGLYANDAYTRASTVTGPATMTVATGRGQAALFGEFAATATYNPTDRVTLRFGYTVTWVEGVALAPDQFANINFARGTGSVNTHGGVFLHGAIVGAEFRW